jgi:Zn-dependent protease with chaperone function
MSFSDFLGMVFGAQARLAVWFPLAGFLAWSGLVRLSGVRSPRVRFWSLVAVMLLAPLVFIAVIGAFVMMHDEGDPAVSAWFSAHLSSRPPVGPAHIERWRQWLYLWPYLVIPVGMICALVLGTLEYAFTALRLWRLPKRREGCVFVLERTGLNAFTFGLVRPCVYVSRAVWEGPHREAVLAHEFAHAARRDPLTLFWARAIRRSTLYLPLGGRLFNELHLEAERACDEAGARAVGVRRYAEALLAFAGSGPPRPRGWRGRSHPRGSRPMGAPGALAFGLPELTLLVTLVPVLQVLGARLRGGLIARRLEALLVRVESRERLVLFWVGFVLVYGLILRLT